MTAFWIILGIVILVISNIGAYFLGHSEGQHDQIMKDHKEKFRALQFKNAVQAEVLEMREQEKLARLKKKARR